MSDPTNSQNQQPDEFETSLKQEHLFDQNKGNTYWSNFSIVPNEKVENPSNE